MNTALLFNSDHPALGSWYGPPVMERILGTGVLQEADRFMRVSVGDVLTYSAAARGKTPTVSWLIELCRSVYQPKEFDCLIRDRLDATHGKATVFCWLFQNMTQEIAEALNVNLLHDPAYLGAMDIDFANPLHLRFFRNSLPEVYRLHGNRCSIFYSMGENEDPDLVIREIFERQGFVVEYEDIGARRTIFDNYDSADHFKRIEDFRHVFETFAGLSADRVSDLVLMLEELHPKLFDAFASAARTLERAETEEDFAQVALSGRRLMEKVADYLFPSRDGEWNGRKIGRAQYRNRLWAYIEQTIIEAGLTDATLLASLGGEADRLVELFNSGLHAGPTREKVQAAFRDLVFWLTRVIELSPKHARHAYLAYQDQILKFLRGVVGGNSEDEGSL
jgi:hypothetical protein